MYFRGTSDPQEISYLAENATIISKQESDKIINFHEVVKCAQKAFHGTEEEKGEATKTLNKYKKQISEDLFNQIGNNENAKAGVKGVQTSFVSFSTKPETPVSLARQHASGCIIEASLTDSEIFISSIDKKNDEQIEEYFDHLKNTKTEKTIFPIFHGSVSEKEVLMPHGLKLDKQKSTLTPLNQKFYDSTKLEIPEQKSLSAPLGSELASNIAKELQELHATTQPKKQENEQETFKNQRNAIGLTNSMSKLPTLNNLGRVNIGMNLPKYGGVNLGMSSFSSSSSSKPSWSNINSKNSLYPINPSHKLADEEGIKLHSSPQKPTEKKLKLPSAQETSKEETSFASLVKENKDLKPTNFVAMIGKEYKTQESLSFTQQLSNMKNIAKKDKDQGLG